MLTDRELEMLSGVMDIDEEESNVQYLVQYHIDVDGGFGDAVETTEPICIFSSREMAERYVEKYSKPVVYDTPYDELYKGRLSIVEVPVLTSVDIEPSKLLK